MGDGYFSRKQDSYDEHPDLLAWIESDSLNPLRQISEIVALGPRVLDIGCGTGLLGRLVKRRNPTVKIGGIEPSLSAGHVGLSDYENFYQGYLGEVLDSDWVAQNEWFVFADVIEHIAYPDDVLRLLIERGPRSAKYVFSVPNVAYYENRLNLMGGGWNYSDSGILESTHVRFYTIQSFLRLLAHVGLFPSRILLLNRVFPPGGMRLLWSLPNILALGAMSNEGFPFCYQFVIEAALQPASSCEQISIGEAGKLILMRSLVREKVKWRGSA